MGGAKRIMEEMEEEAAWAVGFLVQVGTLQSCEGHGDVFDGDGDLERAYRILNAQVTAGTVKRDGRTRRDLTDALKSAYDENCLDSCPSCDRYMRD